MSEETKVCPKCKKHVPSAEWPTKRDGNPAKSCESCLNKARADTRKWREANPEKARERISKWKKGNPDKVKEHHLKWRKANPEKKRELTRKWREANPEKVNERKRRYREKQKAELARLREIVAKHGLDA